MVPEPSHKMAQAPCRWNGDCQAQAGRPGRRRRPGGGRRQWKRRRRPRGAGEEGQAGTRDDDVTSRAPASYHVERSGGNTVRKCANADCAKKIVEFHAENELEVSCKKCILWTLVIKFKLNLLTKKNKFCEDKLNDISAFTSKIYILF